MKKFAKVGALLMLLVGISVTLVGCSGGDEGMGKRNMDNTSSGVIR